MCGFSLDKRGVSRLVVILIVLIVIMLVLIGVPVFKKYRDEAARRGCGIAINAAQQKLNEEYLSNPNMTYEEAVDSATSEVRSLDDMCPAGGYVHIIVTDGDSKYRIVCSLHSEE